MYRDVLITGGAGFVGSSIALTLKREFPSSNVTALDNLRRRGSELNLRRLAEGGVKFVHGDIRVMQDLLEAVPESPELIIECSAEPSAQAGYGSSPEYLMETNLVGCYRCLELCRRTGADLLFLSTSRVYPVAALNALRCRETDSRFELLDDQDVPGASARGIAEQFPLSGARSLYGMTKLTAELMIEEYASAYGFRYVINRCGLIAGPWQMGKSDQGVVTLWAAAHYFGRPLNYIGFNGSGKQVRDLLHIDDVCDLVCKQSDTFDKYAGSLYNVGGGVETSLSLREMTVLCEKATGRNITIGSVVDNRPADVRVYLTDHTKITDLHGWRPRRSAETILVDISRWIERHEALLKPVLLS